jgi:hypothetical protein
MSNTNYCYFINRLLSRENRAKHDRNQISHQPTRRRSSKNNKAKISVRSHYIHIHRIVIALYILYIIDDCSREKESIEESRNSCIAMNESLVEEVMETLGLTHTNSSDSVDILQCGTCRSSGVFRLAQSTEPYTGTPRDKYPGYDQWCVIISCSEMHRWHACKSCHVRVRKMGAHHLAHHDGTENDVAD